MDLLIPHTQAVRKGAPTVFLIGDMPYMSYQVCAQEAVRNAGRFMAECGCDAVKKEFTQDVARGGFPATEHCYKMPEPEVRKLEELLTHSK
jgi:ketopantoate hydroxymethyltransferase